MRIRTAEWLVLLLRPLSSVKEVSPGNRADFTKGGLGVVTKGMQGGRTVGVIGPDEKLGGSPPIGRQNSADALIDVRREERIWKMSLAGLLAG